MPQDTSDHGQARRDRDRTPDETRPKKPGAQDAQPSGRSAGADGAGADGDDRDEAGTSGGTGGDGNGGDGLGRHRSDTSPETIEAEDEQMIDPIRSDPGFEDTESRIAIFGHPIHAMSVAFPVALTFCLLGADILYWWTGDVFWARAAAWAAGTGFLFGMLAGISGTAELLLVPGIRARAPAWTHFIIAVSLLAMLGANWGYRLTGYEAAVLPFGLLMSVLCVIVVSATGWHGGKLVFDYRLGTAKKD